METAVMTQDDLGGANELRRLAGWNQTPNDWRRLLALEPDGCFVAKEEGKVIGTVTTTTYDNTLAWIGMMLVHPERRRQGIGQRLMERALQYLQTRGIDCIRLDATPLGRPLYEKLGFIGEWTLTRCQRKSPDKPELSGAREFTDAEWRAAEEMDLAAFGVCRSRVLRSLAEETLAMFVWPGHGQALGWGMLRPGANSDYLGPLMCAEPEGALRLIGALLGKATANSVFWDVPDDNESARAAAKHFGFSPLRPLTRMRLGPNKVLSDPKAQFAIVDPSVG